MKNKFSKTKKQYDKYYFNNPDVWEKLRNHSVEKEVSFLISIIKNWTIVVKSLIDVGCGSGFHAHGIANNGIKVLGVDLNEYMIKYAKDHYLNVDFQVGSMDDLPKGKKFDALTCLCTTFTYNTTNDAISKTLKEFNKVLNIKGLLVIEVFNPIAFFQSMQLEKSFFLEDRERYNQIGYDLEVEHKVDESSQTVNEVKKIYKLNPRELVQIDQTEFRLLFPMEIQAFLEFNGFKVIGQYGRYDLEYKSLDKTRIITIAEKVKSI